MFFLYLDNGSGSDTVKFKVQREQATGFLVVYSTVELGDARIHHAKRKGVDVPKDERSSNRHFNEHVPAPVRHRRRVCRTYVMHRQTNEHCIITQPKAQIWELNHHHPPF
jgi:hypothetical protein